MKQYKITLNLSFEPHGDDDFEDDYDEYDDDEISDAKSDMTAKKSEKRKAFERTDAYFEKHSVERHIKKNDPMGFVESLLSDGELVTAQWDKKKFQIHMIVNTDMTKEQIIEDLRWNSLEDGEYEACGDTGWIVMTRGPKGEQFGPPWDTKSFWEYGLTDYRSNPIEVVEIAEKEETPDLTELISLTPKGREVYAKLKEQKKGPFFLTESEEDIFRILRTLMLDPALYGKRVIT